MKKEGGINTSKIIIFAIVLTLIGGLIVLGISVLPALFEDAFGVNGGGGDGDGDGEGPDEDEAPPLEYQIESFALDKAAGRATVGVRAYGACRVIVRFATEESYFESTPLLGITYIDALSVTADIEIPKTEPKTEFVAEEITLDVTGELPLHFVAEAVLIDENGNELSARSVDVTNTERFDKFVNTKPEDFPEGSCVLSFDESGCDNFGVLADGVKSITAESISGVILEEDEDGFIDTYIIERPSETVAVGDRLYATDGTNEIILKVASVSYDGDIATVSAARAETDGFTITDFYKFIKADMELYDPSAKSEAVPLSATDEGGEFSRSYTFKPVPFTIEMGDNVTFSGHLKNIKLNVRVSYSWAPDIFGEEYFECEVKADASLLTDMKIKAGVGSESTSYKKGYNLKNVKKFAKIPIPTPIVGLNLKVEFNSLLSWSVAATVGINDIPVSAKMGFAYNSVGGFRSLGNNLKIGVSESADWLTAEGEASLTCGPGVSVGIEFISGLISVELGYHEGISIEIRTDHLTYDHRCDQCFKGGVNLIKNVNVVAKLQFTEKIRLVLKEHSLVDENVPNVLSFYLSKPDKNSSWIVGNGFCPNRYTYANVHAPCGGVENFVCNKHYIDQNGYLIDQNEERDGKHAHDTSYFKIVFSDHETGEVLFETENTIPDGKDVNMSDYRYDFDIPVTVRYLHFEIIYTCRVYECEVTRDFSYRYYPEREVNHRIEGYVINDAYYCYEYCGFMHTGDEHNKVVITDGPSDYVPMIFIDRQRDPQIPCPHNPLNEDD